MKINKAVFSFLVVFLFASSVNASVIYESQPAPIGVPNNSAMAISDSFWAFQSFELQQDTSVASIGAYFSNFGIEQSVFAAIVELDNINDLPDSIDLSTPDLLATSLVSIQTTDGGDFEAPFDIMLTAGFYAIGFGQGSFGADSTLGFGDVSLPSMLDGITNTILPFTAVQAGNPGNVNAQFVLQAASPRFFVKQAVDVAAPQMIIIFAMSLLVLATRRFR